MRQFSLTTDMSAGILDFAMGTGIYPKESRIAAAKRAAVGGKRKRCTKGKNCSAACIAANMVCLVDLPWVGSALTKAKAEIQAVKGKAPAQATPAAKPAPAPTPKAQPAPAPTPKPAEKPITVYDVAYYKKLGLPFLESMLPTAEAGEAAQTPEGKKVIANVKKAISELKAQPAPAAPKPAAAATPAAKAPPAKAPAPAKATSGTYTNWDTDQLVKFQNNFISSDPIKYKAAIDEIQQELDARGYQKPTLAKVPYAKPGSPENRQGLNEAQYQTWNSAFKPFTTETLKEYGEIGNTDFPKKFTPGTLEYKQNELVKKAQLTTYPWAQIKPSTTTQDLPEVNAIQKAANNLGLDRVKKGVEWIGMFTGSEYDFIRNAQRGRVPREYDYQTDKWKQKTISDYKKIADDIEAVLGYMPKPQVPKMRGVAVGDDKLKVLVDLAKSKGTMKELAMNSWSTESRTPQNFAEDGVLRGHGGNRVIYRTMNKKGVPIKELSGIHSENEVLTPANAEYRLYDYHTVVGKKGQTFHVFDMVEY